MKHFQRFKIIVLICPLLFILFSCDKYDGPDALWNPNYDLGATPTIESVSPENTAVAGVSEITINGQNFSAIASENSVYFSNVPVDVKSASPTQLVVYRPNLVDDNFSIKVSVFGAVLYAEYSPYSVEPIGGLFVQVKALGKANTLAIDDNGDVLVHVNKKELYRVLDNGDLELSIGNTSPRNVNDMKIGPDDYIYFSRDRNYINRVPLAGGDFENWASGIPGNVKYFDWDANKVLYAGGNNTGLMCMKPDETFSSPGILSDFDIQSIRVFDNAVYIAAIYNGDDPSVPGAGIYKAAITSANGDVDEPELILDWTQTGDFAETTFTDITFDADGVMYIATDGGADNSLDPMLMMTMDGEFDTFYKGGLLQGPIYELNWGIGDDVALYYLRSTDDINLYEIHRLNMATGGAPEYGRE